LFPENRNFKEMPALGTNFTIAVGPDTTQAGELTHLGHRGVAGTSDAAATLAFQIFDLPIYQLPVFVFSQQPLLQFGGCRLIVPGSQLRQHLRELGRDARYGQSAAGE
jgi:hypothetical protein